jgi:hypothetical protein
MGALNRQPFQGYCLHLHEFTAHVPSSLPQYVRIRLFTHKLSANSCLFIAAELLKGPACFGCQTTMAFMNGDAMAGPAVSAPRSWAEDLNSYRVTRGSQAFATISAPART